MPEEKFREGSLDAPIRHPINFKDPDFLNFEKLDEEMRRVFDICHGCRRCFNLCDSFPTLFDKIDTSEQGEVISLSSNQFGAITDACTMCDMCFMTKCPYVPPHEFNLDFPQLMLRYKTYQRKQGRFPFAIRQLANVDVNGRMAVIVSTLVNWMSSTKNKLFRNLMDIAVGVHKKVVLPQYNNRTFADCFKKLKKNALPNSQAKRKVVIYSTCFVNFNKKETGESAFKVLHHNGVEVEHSYAGCCGMPHLEQGEPEEVVKQAKKISKELLKFVEKGYRVVTLTASCGLMLKFQWPLLVPDNEEVKKLSQNTSDIDEYIVDIANNEGLKKGLEEIDGGVTLHHACHARAQNMGNKARDMLQLIPNIEMNTVERCSGHGGTFGITKNGFEIAKKVGKPTANSIKKNGDTYLASDCPLAGKHLHQISQTDADSSIKSKALHPIELMAKSYRL